MNYFKSKERNSCETHRVKVHYMCAGNVIVALNEMSQPTSSLLCSNSSSSDLGKKRQFY